MHKPVENALKKIGNRHTYQKLMVAYLFLIAGFINYLIMGPTFIFMNPLFQCSFSNQPVDQSIACDRIDQCTVMHDFTIVSRNQLFCDRQVDRNIIQSITAIGSIVGLFVINFISDIKGKKVGIMLALSIAICAVGLTMVGGYTGSVPILAISQFFCGFSGYAMVIMCFLYPSQFSESVFRQKSIVVMNYSWALTCILVGGLFYLQTAWYNFLLLYVLIPMCGALLLSSFFLVQGPNYLYSSKQQKKCLQSLQTIAIINNKVEEFQQVKYQFRFESTQEGQQNKDPMTALKFIIKDKFYRKLTVILILLDFGGSLNYTATNFALDEIGYDYGTNIMTTGLIQFFAYLFLNFFVDKIPRRKGVLFLYGIIVLLGMLFFINPIVQSKIASFIIICMIRFMSTASFTLVIMLLTESYPLNVQAICAGVIEAIAQLGNFLGPIIITMSIDLQIYPIILISFLLILTVLVPTFFMEEKKSADQRNNLIEEEKVNSLDGQKLL